MVSETHNVQLHHRRLKPTFGSGSGLSACRVTTRPRHEGEYRDHIRSIILFSKMTDSRSDGSEY